MAGLDESSEHDPVARARALAPLIREHADDSERNRRLSKPVVEAFCGAELYRVAVPRSIGGLETTPRVQIECIEAASEADGAAGWNLMIGIEVMGFVGAALDLDTAKQLFADPSLVMSGAANPLGRGLPEAGGLRVSGQWPFASGCENSHYFWGQCVVESDEGPPSLREAIIAMDAMEVVDTWKVSGLRGTGSHDVRVGDLFVPDAMTTAVMAGAPLRESGPLFRLHPTARLAYNKVGVATGIARAAIDHFVALANEKKPRLSGSLLRDRPMAQLAVAEAEASLRSTRAFVFEAIEELWEDVLEGRPQTLEKRALVQLACTHAVSAAVGCVERVHAMAGTSANFVGSPLERCMRDVQVIRQHIMVSPQWMEAAGRVLLGMPSGSLLLQ